MELEMERDAASASRVGSSLPVPNVQELAANLDGSREIPRRYIRLDVEADPILDDGNVELPIIDLSRLLNAELHEEELAKLGWACKEWGFFQLINHGIPDELMNKMKSDVIEFFELPLKQREEFAQLPNSLEGYGQAFVTSEEQILDWADLMYIITQPLSSRDLRFWPTHPPTLRSTIDKFSSATKELAYCLFGMMAKILGLDPEIILNKFKDKSQSMRMNCYPPCPKANRVLGISPHTDADGLTLLLQVNNIQGLQIKKDGKWLPIEVLPDTLIINIGDILEIMSNGGFRSIEHRSIINPEERRLSVATFHFPGDEAVVGPLPELVKGCKEKYMSMSFEEYMRAFFSNKLDGRSLLESMKLTD